MGNLTSLGAPTHEKPGGLLTLGSSCLASSASSCRSFASSAAEPSAGPGGSAGKGAGSGAGPRGPPGPPGKPPAMDVGRGGQSMAGDGLGGVELGDSLKLTACVLLLFFFRLAWLETRAEPKSKGASAAAFHFLSQGTKQKTS